MVFREPTLWMCRVMAVVSVNQRTPSTVEIISMDTMDGALQLTISITTAAVDGMRAVRNMCTVSCQQPPVLLLLPCLVCLLILISLS